MRRGVLVGSIAVHAVLGVLLYGIGRRALEAPPRAPIEIEVVPPARPEPDGGGGRTPAPSAPQPDPAPAPAAAPAPGVASAQVPAPAPTATPAAATPSRLAITGYDRGAPAGSDRAGEGTDLGGGGTGLGAGQGAGAGLGLGELPASLPLPSPPPPPPSPPPPAEKPPSKARPPKLIYPARDRQGDEAETFVARVTVDTDGYVVGAHLVRGIGSSRDDLASQLVWRFRYAPALDDEGRAIRATIDQRFLVGY